MSTQFKCAIFDLDGTLVNTIDDLGLATDYVLEQYGRTPKWTQADYKKLVGNGAKKLIERAFEHQLSPEQLEEAYAMFKVKYNAVKMDHAHAYPGIQAALDDLKSRGIRLGVVTNKPVEAARGMVEQIFGKDYFDVVIGATDDLPKKPDPTTVRMALEALGCSAKEAMYFGDSDVDMITGRNAGIETIGVSWGFRSFGELFAQHPAAIIDHPSHIPSLF